MSDTVDLRYTGKGAVIVPDAGRQVEPGEVIPVPADIAASLLTRPEWSKAEKKAAKESES